MEQPPVRLSIAQANERVRDTDTTQERLKRIKSKHGETVQRQARAIDLLKGSSRTFGRTFSVFTGATSLVPVAKKKLVITKIKELL